ncbi:MAG: hypothetical protein Q8903_05680 [Bacteroidota bacterium]|nr:hypothetical protein [Bacteroidota bacterium]
MKKTNLRKLTAIITGLVLMGGMGFAQTTTVTTSTSVSKTLTDGTTAPITSGDPDLVTTGTTVPYLVVPDADLNPSYNLSEGASATHVVSNFTWTVPGTIGSISYPTPKHYIEVNITGAADATGDINVKEQNSAPTACQDATGTSIHVKVIAQPTVSAASVLPTSVCSTDGTTAITLPTFTVTKSTSAPSDPGLQVLATLTLTPLSGASSDVFTDQVLTVDESTGNVTLPTGTTLSKWGKYTLTITSVSDKISRKDIDATRKGFFASGKTVDFYIYKTPKTGAIYHISNL